jgi:hypothetical protein
MALPLGKVKHVNWNQSVVKAHMPRAEPVTIAVLFLCFDEAAYARKYCLGVLGKGVSLDEARQRLFGRNSADAIFRKMSMCFFRWSFGARGT